MIGRMAASSASGRSRTLFAERSELRESNLLNAYVRTRELHCAHQAYHRVIGAVYGKQAGMRLFGMVSNGCPCSTPQRYDKDLVGESVGVSETYPQLSSEALRARIDWKCYDSSVLITTVLIALRHRIDEPRHNGKARLRWPNISIPRQSDYHTGALHNLQG